MKTRDFLNSVATMKDGYQFGELWQYKKTSPVAILPILRKTDIERQYMLLCETELVEITDSGMIDKVVIKNHEKKPLYIRMAEIFTGKTQERMAVRSHIVMPDTTISVDVRCIHASRGIEKDSEMKAGSFASRGLERSNYHSISHGMRVEQSETWDTVRRETNRMSQSASSMSNANSNSSVTSNSTSTTSPTSSDDLKAHQDIFHDLLKNILEEIPYIEYQVGMALHDITCVLGIELFNQSDSWQALRSNIFKKEGEYIARVQEDEVFGFDREMTTNNTRKVLAIEYDERVIYESEVYKVIALSSDTYFGEVTELEGKVIHLSIISVDDPDEETERKES